MKNLKTILLKAFIMLLSTFIINNINGQISNILPANRLPNSSGDGWQYWASAGSDMLLNGITVDSCMIATDHNIIGDGTTDNTAAFNSMIASSRATSYKVIYFPPGNYKFKGTIALSKTKIILKGFCGSMNQSNKTLFTFDLPAAPSGISDCINITGDYCGIEDIAITQDNSGSHDKTFHTNTIVVYASNCWIRGVESTYTRRFHVELSGSHNTVSGCCFHHADNYSDDAGRAYGVCISNGKYNLVENNVFYHLRHSILMQYDAQYNVVAYNYSTDICAYNGGYGTKFKCSGMIPDLCFHGQGTNGPSYNLCEGNIVVKIGIDNEHGSNGKYNTFFRSMTSGMCSIYSLFIDDFTVQSVSNADDKQYNQNVVACNSKPDKAGWKNICSYGFFRYWFEKDCYSGSKDCGCSTGNLKAKWDSIGAQQSSYYNKLMPEFWMAGIVWPFDMKGVNPAKARKDNADNVLVGTALAIKFGWNKKFYKNMSGPCTF